MKRFGTLLVLLSLASGSALAQPAFDAERFPPDLRVERERRAAWEANPDPETNGDALERLLFARLRGGTAWREGSLELARSGLAAAASPRSIASFRLLGAAALLANTDFDSAAAWAARALERVPPEAVELRGEILVLLTRARLETENFDAARQTAESAIEYCRERFGGEDARTWLARQELHRVEQFEGQRDAAAAGYAEVERGLGRALSPEHPLVASTLTERAYTLRGRGAYAEAESLALRARELRVRAFTENDAEVGRIEDLLAGICYLQARFDEAEAHWRRALEIRESVLPADHAEIALNLGGLALIATSRGDYARALELREREREIYVSRLGPWHSAVGSNRMQTARLYGRLGDVPRQREELERALEVKERALGPSHESLVATLVDIAHLYVEGDEPEKGIEGFERAIGILEQDAEGNAADLAGVLNALGNAHRRAKHYAQAKPLYDRALETYARVLGDRHPYLGNVLQNRAEALSGMGDLEAAERDLRRSRETWEDAYGADHPRIAESAQKLADLLYERGRFDEALDSALECERIGREHFRVVARTLSERQALAFADSRARSIDLALSIAAASDSPAQRERAWNALAASRAIVLDELAQRRQSLLASDESTEAAWTEYREASTDLASKLVARAGRELPTGFREELRLARERVEASERELARRSVRFRESQQRQALALRDLVDELPPDGALVAYARFGERQSREAPSDRVRQMPSYLAMVWAAGDEGPRCVELGEAETIDLAVARWRGEIEAAQLPLDEITSAMLGDYREAGRELREAVWDPVAAVVPEARRVFLVLDSTLNLVSMASLPTGSDGYLLETGPSFHLLDAERDLVPRDTEERGVGLLALGGVEFDAEAQGTHVAAATFRGPSPDCLGFDRLRFAALPASAAEVEGVVGEWGEGGRALLGRDARESVFKAEAPGRRVLHLATHGFFLGGDCVQPREGQRGIAGLAPARDPQRLESNPLRLSGLALAGANRRAERAEDSEDGILTAEEIVALDLRGAQWVVLSACDTGRGEIEVGEGVLGLRRATQVAGARTVILSLWSVNDEIAGRWMRDLYRAKWKEGRSTLEAVEFASRESLRRLRAEGRVAHPAAWAAFVAAGDWR